MNNSLLAVRQKRFEEWEEWEWVKAVEPELLDGVIEGVLFLPGWH